MSFSQTHWINGEKCNKKCEFCFNRPEKFFFFLKFNFCIFQHAVNNEVLMSPPHNNALLNQRESLLITQPSSIPSSPLGSPGAQSLTTFCLQSPTGISEGNLNHEIDNPTTDPNWQATKPTVRERNAAMFNNELMADIKFVVGCDG